MVSGQQGGGERALSNMTDCEEGEGGPNSQGEQCNLPQAERGVSEGMCVCACACVRACARVHQGKVGETANCVTD